MRRLRYLIGFPVLLAFAAWFIVSPDSQPIYVALVHLAVLVGSPAVLLLIPATFILIALALRGK
jgi:hypothetical protein